MGSKYNEDDMSNGNSKGNDTSLIVNVNDTQSDIDEHEESHYSEPEVKGKSSRKENSSKKSSRNNDSSKKSSHKEKETKSRSKVDVSKTRYFWVSGIPDGTKTGQLEEVFLQFGKVLAIKIIRGGTDSTLLGFVKMESAEQAQKCMEKLNRTMFRGNKIELLKERPADKDSGSGTKPEKIGFRDSRKPFISRPPVRPHFRPPHHPPTRGHFRPPMTSSRGALHPPHREHHPRILEKDLRRQEREELMKIERERDRIKLERMKLEREKAELLKIERESRVLERDRFHDDKRIRPITKRSIDVSPFLDEKRFDEYSRRDEFGGRRFEARGASPDRKIGSSSGRSFGPRDSTRQERFSDKYDSGSKWNTIAESSWSGNDHRSWHSNTGYDSRIAMNSNLGSSSFSRLHPGSEISQTGGGIPSRGYFGNNRRY